MEFGITMWLGSSVWGAVPAVLMAVLLTEAYIRRRRSPPDNPTADVFD
jgi:hypothetical protein